MNVIDAIFWVEGLKEYYIIYRYIYIDIYMIEIYLVSYKQFFVTITSHAISFINSNISGETEYAIVSC